MVSQTYGRYSLLFFAVNSGDYGEAGTKEFLKDFHRRRLQVLAEAGPDLIAFETIPNKLEAEVYYFAIRVFCLAFLSILRKQFLIVGNFVFFRRMSNFSRSATSISLHGFPSTQKMECILWAVTR
jgi:hypothetical protein